MEGPGVSKVDIDFDNKRATARFDASKTKAQDALGRLTNQKKYGSSSLVALGASFEADNLRVASRGEVKGHAKGAKGKLLVVLEPASGHKLNGEGQPELEVEAKGAGLKFKVPVLKEKKAVDKKRELVLEFELADKLEPGEVAVEVEIRLVDVKGKDAKPRVVQLTVPVLVQ